MLRCQAAWHLCYVVSCQSRQQQWRLRFEDIRSSWMTTAQCHAPHCPLQPAVVTANTRQHCSCCYHSKTASCRVDLRVPPKVGMGWLCVLALYD